MKKTRETKIDTTQPPKMPGEMEFKCSCCGEMFRVGAFYDLNAMTPQERVAFNNAIKQIRKEKKVK